jgi:iron uptake system EfeUOB component EfeO/EfeM
MFFLECEEEEITATFDPEVKKLEYQSALVNNKTNDGPVKFDFLTEEDNNALFSLVGTGRMQS